MDVLECLPLTDTPHGALSRHGEESFSIRPFGLRHLVTPAPMDELDLSRFRYDPQSQTLVLAQPAGGSATSDLILDATEKPVPTYKDGSKPTTPVDFERVKD